MKTLGLIILCALLGAPPLLAEDTSMLGSLFSLFKKKDRSPAITNQIPDASAALTNTQPIIAPRPKLTPQRKRITDQAIASDLRSLDSVQRRLADLNNKGVLITSYHFAKSQAWLDFARDAYMGKDRSQVVEAALEQSVVIIEQLESGSTNLSMETPQIPQYHEIRPDLWREAAACKAHTNFLNAADRVAQLEVQLVWAGHEEKSLGWRHAKPYIQAAERLVREAKAKLANEYVPEAGVAPLARLAPATTTPSATGQLQPQLQSQPQPLTHMPVLSVEPPAPEPNPTQTGIPTLPGKPGRME